MIIHLLQKKKGRLYRSEDIVRFIFSQDGDNSVSLSYDASGAPSLISKDGASSCGISISDTARFWAAAVAPESNLGLDIEESSRRIKASSVRRLHPLEIEYLAALEEGGAEWTNEFLCIWTRKEAYSKFCGAGLAIGVGSFSVLDADLAYRETISCKGRPPAAAVQLSLPFGLIGTLCTEPGAGLGEPEIRLIKYEGSLALTAREAAADMLFSRNMSSQELIEKLVKKGYDRAEASQVASEMKAKGYIDDTYCAVRLARRLADSGSSRSRIRRLLKEKGFSGPDTDTALENLEDEGFLSDKERAAEIAAAMLPVTGEEEAADKKALAKLARKLSSLGYSANTIYSILDKYR